MGLLDRGEHKQYYTLVVDVVRRYLEQRYGVAAMDRTTGELIGDFDTRGIRVENLEDLLTSADLVKFAKFVPPVTAGETAMQTARGIIVATTPRIVPSADGERASEAA